MKCPRCVTGFVLEDRDEDNKYSRLHKLGKVWYCVNCGHRIYEYIAALPAKLAMHEPRHRGLRV